MLQFLKAIHFGLLVYVLPVQRWWASRITLDAWQPPARQLLLRGTLERMLWLLPSPQRASACLATEWLIQCPCTEHGSLLPKHACTSCQRLCREFAARQ